MTETNQPAGSRRSANRAVLVVVIAGVLIATFGSTLLLKSARRTASLDGTWIARMVTPGKEPVNVPLQFRVSGNSIAGTAGGETITTGTLMGNTLMFSTSTAAFTGNIKGSTLELTRLSPGTLPARGSARRTD